MNCQSRTDDLGGTGAERQMIFQVETRESASVTESQSRTHASGIRGILEIKTEVELHVKTRVESC